MQVRQLRSSDIVAYRALLDLLSEAFEDPDTYSNAQPDDAYIRTVLAKDSVIALTASSGPTLVGGLIAYELPKLEQARSEIYIYDLAVLEPFRGKGAATALIARVQKIATERGAWVVYVQADHGDAPAIALYSKLGVREDVLHFDIPPA